MSSNTSVEATTEETKESPLTEVFSQMREDGCEFFLSLKLKPTVEIPDDGFQQ